MLLAFGCSWPASILKSWRTRFVRGKSPAFMCIVMTGYVCGILHKLLNPPPPEADFLAANILWLYVLVLALVATDFILYLRFRNNSEPIR